jgi:hypothetical protein
MDFAAVTATIAGLLAFFALGFAHYISRELWGTLHRVLCYVIGVLLIGIIYGAWCLAQPVPISGSMAFVAFSGIVVGAGLGTVLAYGVDHYAGVRRENRLLRAREGGQE